MCGLMPPMKPTNTDEPWRRRFRRDGWSCCSERIARIVETAWASNCRDLDVPAQQIADPGGKHPERERLADGLHPGFEVFHRNKAGVCGDEQHGQARTALAGAIGNLP